MIAPKVAAPTKAEENAAYELATARDNNTCVRCGRGGDMNRDHRINRSQGGWTVVENLQLLCGTGTLGCHGWVTAHPEEAFTEGWAVPSWAYPDVYPGRRLIRTSQGALVLSWVVYTAEGKWFSISAAEAAARIAGTY